MQVINRMVKCYYFYDNNQLVFKDIFEETMRYFMPSVTLCPVKFKYISASSNFGTLDFRQLMLEKVHVVSDIIAEHMSDGTEILISDIDIIIYKGFTEYMHLGDADIMFQKECRDSGINTGFILLKCSPLTHRYWKEIEESMVKYKHDSFINEQAVVNSTIEQSGLNWKLFDDTIWAYSNQPKPHGLCLHHANCTVPHAGKSSFQLKCAQMISELFASNHVLKDKLISTLKNYI